MARNVLVAAASSNQTKRVVSSARTWGELRNEPEVAALIIGDVEAIVNPGKVTLGRDESVLPEGDFQLYLITKKNKAGEDTYENLAIEVLQAVRKGAAIASGEGIAKLRDELMEVVADHFNLEVSQIAPGAAASPATQADPEAQAALLEAKNLGGL